VVWCERGDPSPSHSLWIRSKVHQTRDVYTTGYWYWYTECSRTHLNALPAMMRPTLIGKTVEMHHWSVLATTTNPGEPAPEQSADLDFRVGQERLCSPSHPMPILSSSPLAGMLADNISEIVHWKINNDPEMHTDMVVFRYLNCKYLNTEILRVMKCL